MMLYVMAEKNLVGETHYTAQKRGNGLLRREIWVDGKGNVMRYNLAYINPATPRSTQVTTDVSLALIISMAITIGTILAK